MNVARSQTPLLAALLVFAGLGPAYATQRPNVSPPIAPIVRELGVDMNTLVSLDLEQQEEARRAGLRLISLCPDCRLAAIADEGPCGWARTQRQVIAHAVHDGHSEEDIVQAFVSVYGPNVLALESTNPARRASWLIPYALVVAGLILLGFVGRRLSRRGSSDVKPAAVRGSDELNRRLAKELADLD